MTTYTTIEYKKPIRRRFPRRRLEFSKRHLQFYKVIAMPTVKEHEWVIRLVVPLEWSIPLKEEAMKLEATVPEVVRAIINEYLQRSNGQAPTRTKRKRTTAR